VRARALAPPPRRSLLASCGHGGGGASIEKSELPTLVLQPSDLPKAFSQFDEGRQVRIDAHPGPRGDPARFGRVDGWKARYRWGGARTAPEPPQTRPRSSRAGRRAASTGPRAS